ncbi:MAG: ATP-binding protein [Lachnospiraceae bacterium]|nr:ATP-binding protein [Lachnospiraceae bacterium]
MALTNEQYDRIMRDYEQKQREARREHDRRLEEILRKIPEFGELSQSAASAVAAFSAGLMNSESDASGTRERLRSIAGQREALLTKAGFPADYLEAVYSCPDCQDTGFIGREKCHCFRQKEVALLYSQSHLGSVSDESRFSSLREDVYGDDTESLRRFQNARDASLAFVRAFPDNDKNLLFMGGVGTGKTTLSGCIARELLDRGFSVIYFSAVALFEHLAEIRFSRESDDERTDPHGDLYDCDLLVIDDLGTELTNAFSAEQLFNLLNERIFRKKHMIISTNLGLDELQRVYAERIFSRITSSFSIWKLTGNDIRLRIRMQ